MGQKSRRPTSSPTRARGMPILIGPQAGIATAGVLCETKDQSMHWSSIRTLNGANELVSAEITPQASKSEQAARQLQQSGFRVLSIGETISVDGSPALWTSRFGVQFETTGEEAAPGSFPGGSEPRQVPIESTLSIPQDLESFIKGVSFVAPPEFF
ncbi:hypothetical protein [Hoeflea poritis]|uniref:Uncharacterized protein n=1 Tax=Hoeflea poritis TaxID=2993659 RepID=A0ABT4VWP1_9HYPH|nr:hypothetical protein [Hoeflea poritis]MDA4848625.1 hypothetical protein [Hoeflea poritis]